MRRTLLNLIVDLTSLLLFLALAATGLVMRFAIPRGGSGRRHGGSMLLGWRRCDWGDLHFWLASVAVGVLLVHLVLHWTWIRNISLHLAERVGSPQAERHHRVAWMIGLPAIVVVMGSCLFVVFVVSAGG